MRYFNNSDLTKLYNVSHKAIRNWIDKAREGKNDLELVQYKGRLFIADSMHNDSVLAKLAQSGKKYRNKRSHKLITPSSDFFKLYSSEQVIDIINCLDKYRELPLQYCYLGAGGAYWDSYLHKLYSVDNTYLRGTIDLLDLDSGYLADTLTHYSNINVIDVGVGNGLAIKELVSRLIKTGKLRKYVGIDISPYLLDATENNLREWFGSKISIEKYVRDITFQRFPDLLSSDSYGEDAKDTINIVLFLGGTVTNFSNPTRALETIGSSMASKDILVSTVRLDSENLRTFFDFNVSKDRKILALPDKHVLELLSVESSLYEVDQFFDKESMSRFIQVRPNVSLSIEFKLGSFKRRIDIEKEEPILLTRMRHFTDKQIVKLYEASGFTTLRTSKSRNEEYMLLVSRASTSSYSSL